MKIREATIDDLEGIARVHLDSWRSTYEGIISETYLAQLSLEGRMNNWRWTFNRLNQDEGIFVAEDPIGRIVGFSYSGKNRNTEFEHDGELYAIYLLQEYQGQGIGRLIFHAAVQSLKNKGYESMMLWVLEDNPALGFYRRMGGSVIGEKKIVIGEDELVELAVGWSSLGGLQ